MRASPRVRPEDHDFGCTDGLAAPREGGGRMGNLIAARQYDAALSSYRSEQYTGVRI